MSDQLARLAEHIRDLTERGKHIEPLAEPVPYIGEDGIPRKKRFHPSAHLSLLDQLRAAAHDRAQNETEAADKAARTVPRADEDAMDRLDTIRRGVAFWLTELEIEPRAPQYAAALNRNATRILGLFGNLHRVPTEIIRVVALQRAAADTVARRFDVDLWALVGAAAAVDDRDQVDRLAADVARWRTWCRIIAGWDSPPWRPNVRCPHCDQLPGDRAGLRIRVQLRAAVCLSCDTTWSDDGPVPIDVLAEHIRQSSEAAAALTPEQLAALADPGKASSHNNRGGPQLHGGAR